MTKTKATALTYCTTKTTAENQSTLAAQEAEISLTSRCISKVRFSFPHSTPAVSFQTLSHQVNEFQITPAVTTRRLLPLLNLLGCLILTAVAITQWRKEHDLHHRFLTQSQQLTTAQEQLTTQKSLTTALESDILQLKESITSLAAARQETEATLAKLTAEREAQIAAAAQAATAATTDQSASATTQQTLQAQTAVWEKAIAERDAKISDLDTRLTTTRERLDQAIAKLKQAAARTR